MSTQYTITVLEEEIKRLSNMKRNDVYSEKYIQDKIQELKNNISFLREYKM